MSKRVILFCLSFISPLSLVVEIAIVELWEKLRNYFTCVFRFYLDYGIRVFEEKDKIRMDGDNLCGVVNSLSIIASEKIGRNYPLRHEGNFIFEWYIVMKKLNKK